MSLAGYVYQNTEAVMDVVDRGYNRSRPKRLVVWSHKYGDNHFTVWTDSTALSIVSAVCSTAGLPMTVPDEGLQTWGNDTAQGFLTDAVNAHASGERTATVSKVILLGVSMGGLAALNWARANATKVAAIGLMYPAVNLQAVHDGTGGSQSWATQTESAYGGSLAAFNAAVAAHDPAQHAADFQQFQIKMWYSTADTVVGSANQTAFATAVGGSNFTSRSLGAVTHADMTQVPSSEIAAFVGQYA